MVKKARLIYGSTYPEGELPNMDLRWWTEIKLPDPHYFVEMGDQFEDKALLVSSLEHDRACLEARNCRVVLFNPYIEEAARKGENPLILFLKEQGIGAVVLHPETQVVIAELLREGGFSVEVGSRPWFKNRFIRTDEEIHDIIAVQRAIEAVLWLVREKLAAAETRNSLVYENDEPLTSEAMRKFIEDQLYFRNCLCPMDTICSSGAQAGRPHELGTGPLKANAPIVCDIFPRSRTKWGRYADCTRTFFKGKPSAQATWIYGVVHDAQELGISLIHDGADAGEVHRKVEEFMREKGYALIHGLGHGLNLRCHEFPSVFSRSTVTLKKGMIVTVEPGIYLPDDEVGIRLEDLLLVEEDSAKNLTNFPKRFEDAVIL